MRNDITGADSVSPNSFSDFNSQRKAEFVLSLRRLIAGLREASALLLAEASASPKVRIVDEYNPNLFRVAATHYGNVRGWDSIAELSGMSLPVMDGEFELRIPAERQ